MKISFRNNFTVSWMIVLAGLPAILATLSVSLVFSLRWQETSRSLGLQEGHEYRWPDTGHLTFLFPCTRMLLWRTWYPLLFPPVVRQTGKPSPHSPLSPPPPHKTPQVSEGLWRRVRDSLKAASESRTAAVYSSSCVSSSSSWLTSKRIIKDGAIIRLDPKVFCVTQCLSGHISCVLCGHSAASFRCSVFWLAPFYIKQMAEERSILILIRSTPFWKIVQMKQFPGKL